MSHARRSLTYRKKSHHYFHCAICSLCTHMCSDVNTKEKTHLSQERDWTLEETSRYAHDTVIAKLFNWLFSLFDNNNNNKLWLSGGWQTKLLSNEWLHWLRINTNSREYFMHRWFRNGFYVLKYYIFIDFQFKNGFINWFWWNGRLVRMLIRLCYRLSLLVGNNFFFFFKLILTSSDNDCTSTNIELYWIEAK